MHAALPISALRSLRQLRSGSAALALLFVLGIAQAAIWLLGLPESDVTTAFAWRAVLLFALQLAAVALVWHRRDRATLWIIVGFALVFRMAAWGWAPELSTDLNRYVWDGRVQMSGVSPYAHPPSDRALAHLRDGEIWPHINRPDSVTVYPPGAQVAFLALAGVGGDSLVGVKTSTTGLELLALLLVALALHRRKIPIGRLALYAWSPLVIAEICASGHVDALVLPLVVGALLMADRGRAGWAGGLIGAAALVKLYPILLLAAIRRGGRNKAVAIAAAVVALGYLPYLLIAGDGVLGFLPDYARSAEDFNPSARGYVEMLLQLAVPHARELAMVVCLAALGLALVSIARREDEDSFRLAAHVALAFVLLVPTAMHPWYALWLVALITISPHPAGIWVVGLLPLSYIKYGTVGEHMPGWVLAVEWLPAFLLVGLVWARAKAHRAVPA